MLARSRPEWCRQSDERLGSGVNAPCAAGSPGIGCQRPQAKETIVYRTVRTLGAAAALMLAGTTTIAAAAGSSQPFTSTSQLAIFSAVRGYPAVGGSAVLAGPLNQQPGGAGAQVDHITTTGHPARDVFTSRATDVHYLPDGTQRFKFASTDTLGADGSLRIVGSGSLTAGTGAYRGASGGFSFVCIAPSATAIITCHAKGTVMGLVGG
jgi:hypothetical protein